MMKIPGTFSDSYSLSYDTHTSAYSDAFHIYIEQLWCFTQINAHLIGEEDTYVIHLLKPQI